MNYDPIYYHTLTPLVLSYKVYAGTIFAAAFILHWALGSWYGSSGDFKTGFQFWKSCGLSLLVYTLCFVPVPNPGELIGFRDADVNVSQTQFQKTTVAIFIIERLSYGTDQLAKQIISWDITIQAQESLTEEYASGPGGVIQTSRAPNDSEIIYNFIILRAQYLMNVQKNMWNHDDLEAKGVIQEESEETLGTWDLLSTLTKGQLADYLIKQASVFLYNAASTLGMFAAFFILLVIALILYLVAGLVKFAGVFVTGIVLLLMPFGWLINGKKVLSVAFNLLVVYIPMKLVVIIVIWLAFFLVEAIQLQGYLEVASEYPLLSETLGQFKPGFIYTEAGSGVLAASEQILQLGRAPITSARTLLSTIVCLLCMVYILIKTPSLISAMLGIQSMTDDIASSIVFIAGAVASGGAAIKGKLAMKAAKQVNTIATETKPEPAAKHS